VLLVGLTTYLIVFNLNNIVIFCGGVYCSYKMKVIENMKSDPNSKWKEKGPVFDFPAEERDQEAF